MLIKLIGGAAALVLYGAGVAVTIGVVLARLERGGDSPLWWDRTLIVVVPLAWPFIALGVGIGYAVSRVAKVIKVAWEKFCQGIDTLVELGYRIGNRY